MSPALHLTISTPSVILVADAVIVALRAEDESGSFGILPGHADFLTVLTPSVLRWRAADAIEHFCAVEEGVFRVSEGSKVNIACRNGVLGDSLADLQARIDAARAQRIDSGRKARVEETRRHAQAVRELLRYLRPASSTGRGGA
jgi:F-type H+-transporting ATPase subunit epsilon